MEEIDIWTSVMQWATEQVPGLVNEPNSWSSEDVTTIRAIISDCMPHIRFFNISSEDFHEKIVPYDELLTKELRRDIMLYHFKKDYKPNFTVLPPRKSQAATSVNINVSDEDCKPSDINSDMDSIIINKQQAAWISQKIMESNTTNQRDQRTSGTNNNFHKLTLLYRHSRDGSVFENYRHMCAEKGPTVSVGKVLNTEEILGGYNPISWKPISVISGEGEWFSTSESFIFSLDKDKSENHIVSPVVNNEYAIGESRDGYPWFGTGDLVFGGEDYDYDGFAKQGAYRIAIRSGSELFKWADWEVFLVTKVN